MGHLFIGAHFGIHFTISLHFDGCEINHLGHFGKLPPCINAIVNKAEIAEAGTV